VLRSGDRPGIEQELWALLTLYQLLRMAMVTAVETRPGTDPDRASFTSALEAAREELTAARGVCPDGPAGLPGVIGRAVLATLLPARRQRYSARKVKCATSRYLNRDDGRPHAATAITSIEITVRTPPLSRGRPRRHSPARPRPPQPPTRRQRITAIITSQPPRDWTGYELATRLNAPPRYLLSQLAEWAALASSPAPPPPPTGSTRRHSTRPRQPPQTLNYAALLRDGFASLDTTSTRQDRAPTRNPEQTSNPGLSSLRLSRGSGVEIAWERACSCAAAGQACHQAGTHFLRPGVCHEARLRRQRPLTGANAAASRVCSRICVRVPEWRLSESGKRPACGGSAPALCSAGPTTGA